MVKTAIQPTRAENYPEWYQQVIKAADMAEVSPVRGCMIIKPWGYALWENIQQQLDQMIKATGHENIYCPLFIPLSFLEKEAEHVEGFAKECAVVTHSKLSKDEDGHLVPTSPLEEPLIVRPTSEAIIGDAFSRWVESYRDLPICINQWANIVRWEMRTRMFLRTSEFLWQEGHTAHASESEAREEALKMLNVYVDFVENHLAMPVLKGEKSASVRFPGAVSTYCIEAMMQDKNALQTGTSHFLGQSFAKAFDIKYLDDKDQRQHAWTTSWGVSTRLIGGIIMMHADDDGLVLPPRVAPQQVVILPVVHQESDRNAIMVRCEQLADALQRQTYCQAPIRVKIDSQTGQGGKRAWGWVKKGVPIRVEIGAKEIANNSVCIGMRHKPYQERETIVHDIFVNEIITRLTTIHDHCYQQALSFQQANTIIIDSKDDFYDYFAKNNKKGNGFALAHWNGSSEIEAMIKKDLQVTIRCIPTLDETAESGTCPFSGKKSTQRVVWAKAY